MAHQTRVSIVNERTASHNPVVTELKSNGLATFNKPLGFIELNCKNTSLQ